MTYRSPHTLLPGLAPALVLALTLAGCGSGSDDAAGAPPSTPGDGGGTTDGDSGTDTGGSTDSGTDEGDSSPVIAGDIALYGVVAVGDIDGESSGDALASFSRLSASVAAEAFGTALDPAADVCTVEADDGRPDLMLLSPLYLPVPDAVALDPVDAGGTVLLSSTAGSWIELQARPADTFYTRPSSDGPLTGPVPTGLVANVTGATFPAFTDAALPDVAPLVGVTYAGGDTVTRDTRFTWEPSGAANARVRIETATVGSFFAENGVGVSCLVPDIGEFVFPPDARAALGEEFEGSVPDLSRVAIESVRQGDALLVLVRESFAP